MLQAFFRIEAQTCAEFLIFAFDIIKNLSDPHFQNLQITQSLSGGDLFPLQILLLQLWNPETFIFLLLSMYFVGSQFNANYFCSHAVAKSFLLECQA